MGDYLLSFTIFRIILPCIMAICASFRPSVISGIYFLFLLYFPFVPVPAAPKMSRHAGIYLKSLMVVSSLTCLVQAAFQIYLLKEQPYGHMLQDCEFLERLFRTIGLVKVLDLSVKNVINWVYVEPTMFITSIIVWWSCKKLAQVDPGETEGPISKKPTRNRYLSLWTSLGRYAVLVSMCFAAIIKPSVFGGLYFLVFLSSATWWACYKKLQKKFAILLKCLMFIVFLHMVALYAYQTQWPQEFLPQNEFLPRLFGLIAILSYDCQRPREIQYEIPSWDAYAYPVALYIFYAVSIFETKLLKKYQLMKTMSATRLLRRRTLRQDSLGNLVISTETDELATDSSLNKSKEHHSVLGKYAKGKFIVTLELYQHLISLLDIPTAVKLLLIVSLIPEERTKCEKIVSVLDTILKATIRSSYIGTNIIMMAWSITYLSWITFVLLLWANILWLIPKQRKAMLRTSPLLVFYAWFLLLSAYIFSMNLTNAELPSKIYGINLAQIGFVKILVLPFGPLAIKCLFTGMFWITLRQFMQERVHQKQSNALADMALQLGSPAEKDYGTTTMYKIGRWFRNLLASVWIWIVAITLFCVAVTGQKMTGFRIIYMALFLIFVVTFQLSYRIWKKIMLVFWLTVIVYSMIMLILVYTYQFDHFPEHWRLLGVPLEQQQDIGLELYETKQLFVRLVTPTFFIIVTAIQIHCFHERFMSLQEREDIKQKPGKSSVIYNVSDINIPSEETDKKKKCLNYMNYYLNVFFLFLEIHMAKLVLFVGFLASTIQPCALEFIVVILLLIGVVNRKRTQNFCIYTCSIFLSLLILARMNYQIQYFRHSDWEIECTKENYHKRARNNARWLGFCKADEIKSVMFLIRWDIIYIVVTTLWTTVRTRQLNLRKRLGIPHAKVDVMFPNVTRAEADESLENFIKYTMNYGFFKFGIELCLIMTVILIGIRMDFYAILYAIWLCALFSLRRETLSKIWMIYIFFIVSSILFQYSMVVGLMPSFCIVFPWDSTLPLQKLQEFVFLTSNLNTVPVMKLLCDYILLIFTSRQALIFKQEKQQKNKDTPYPGGSNDVIVHHSEQSGFENPVPDFMTYTRSFLDIFKVAFFNCSLWLTLAVLVLTGAVRVSIFSIGYLIGAFTFLWQGTDLYLWPIPNILNSWNKMLAYNVLVITLKTLIQIAGCFFAEDVARFACWFIRLFAIGCFSIQKGDLLTSECIDPQTYNGILLDGIIFMLLIMQRRVFHSYNFFHMINDTKANSILGHRGAELFEEIRLKRVQTKEQNEQEVLKNINSKMEKIKDSQKHVQGAAYQEPETHAAAIRSGDYYMFGDLHVEDSDPFESLATSVPADEIEYEDLDDEGYTIGEFLSTAMKSDIDNTLQRASMNAELRKQKSESLPSTSQIQDDEVRKEETKNKCGKIKKFFVFIYYFFDSVMFSFTKFINSYTRDYRYVMKVLNEEKEELKQIAEYCIGKRIGQSQVWEPTDSYHSEIRNSELSSQKRTSSKSEMSPSNLPSILRLLKAILCIIVGNSELFCYFIIFLNQITSATLLTLPLPLMVFLWGTLTIPRPTKTFWVTLIAYTQVIVLIKCLFQFDLIPWNRRPDAVADPVYAPRLIGIGRNETVVWEIFVLIFLFYHRSLLKRRGLWHSCSTTAPRTETGFYRVGEDGEITPIEEKHLKMRSFRLDRLKENLQDTIADGNLDAEQKTSFIRARKQKPLYKRLFRGLEHTDEFLASASLLSDEQDQDLDDDDDTGGSKLIPMEEIPEGEDLNNLIKVTSERVEPGDHFPQSLKLAICKYAETFGAYFSQLINPKSKISTDVYAFMFICDFFNFFVLLFGYTSFDTHALGGVETFLKDNKVPVLFLLMLIIQFILIIIDRGIYLRKNRIAKIIFQFVLIIIIHLWLLVLFPLITERSFNSVVAPQMYYMVKCFYLLLSAYQIRCGYPTKILGNFLCKRYNYVNMFLYKVFLLIPFLFELRTLMDWMWTDTSMTVFNWIKMEDIYAHIFHIKCQRYCQKEFPQTPRKKKGNCVKYLIAGGILLGIILIIWFPLIFFALGNAVGHSNIPSFVSLSLQIGSYDSVYDIAARKNHIYQFSQEQYEDLLSVYERRRKGSKFIKNYKAADIAVAHLSSDSANIWTISPPDRERMIDEVRTDLPINIVVTVKVLNKASTPEFLKKYISESIPAFGPDGERNPSRINLEKMLKAAGSESTPPVLLREVIPKFLRVTDKKIFIGDSLMDQINEGDNGNMCRNASLYLNQSPDSPTGWWKLNETCQDLNYKLYLSKIPFTDCDNIILYTFNDRTFPAILNFVSGKGVIGLYMLYFYVTFKITRSILLDNLGKMQKIWYEDIPNPDRIFAMLNFIYYVRSCRMYEWEELMFAKLLFLMRSRELCIKMTRRYGDPYDPRIAFIPNQNQGYVNVGVNVKQQTDEMYL